MKKEMNNKGFSLVELIIVIAIMAVLIGLLAPQYMKYLNNSKVSGDITNAQSLATTINAEIANGNSSVLAMFSSTTLAGGADVSALGMAGVQTIPESKLSAAWSWGFTVDGVHGVEQITLNSFEIYPYPEKSGNYKDEYHE